MDKEEYISVDRMREVISPNHSLVGAYITPNFNSRIVAPEGIPPKLLAGTTNIEPFKGYILTGPFLISLGDEIFIPLKYKDRSRPSYFTELGTLEEGVLVWVEGVIQTCMYSREFVNRDTDEALLKHSLWIDSLM